MNIAVWLESPYSSCWTITPTQIEYMKSRIPGAQVQYARSPEEFVELLPKAETAVSWFFEQKWLDRAPLLRYLVTPAAGFDYFSVELPPQVQLKNSRFQGKIISESVMGMLLSQSRRIAESTERMRREEWPRVEITNRMRRLSGSHVVILGFGNIGHWIARRAKLFGCKLTGIKRNSDTPAPDFFTHEDRIEPVARLESILSTADHLVLALPRSPQTDHIIGRRELKKLPRGAALYNVGRGNAIDEAALADALGAGWIDAAYLDVFETEPLPQSSPLRRFSNCYLMPHSSAAAPDYLDLFIDEFSARYRRWHAG
ncbi:MAG: NAD(P)-dependent oxidoreductase [Spirochaetia bacterium]|nr:NAD(P)-dependent oxidoreductase [Spirochaetia bacterium]